MIRIRWVALFTLVAALGIAAVGTGVARAEEEQGPQALALGAAIPMKTTSLKNVDGKNITLASAAGKKGTLVFFICNHCPWVKAWQTRIASIGNGARSNGIGVVAVNSNDPSAYPEDSYDSMKKRAKEIGYKFNYVVDATSDLSRAFGASHTPEVFLFDAAGKLVYHGAIDDNAHDESAVEHRWLQQAVESVQSGKAVGVAETKALGCGIKARAKKTS